MKSCVESVVAPTQVFGSAFSATALLMLGLRMVGQMHQLKGANLVAPGILIGVKWSVFSPSFLGP